MKEYTVMLVPDHKKLASELNNFAEEEWTLNSILDRASGFVLIFEREKEAE